MSLSIRHVTDPYDPALEAFGRIQNATYSQPETLIPAEYFGPMIAQPPQTSQRQNLLLVAEQGGEVVGGTLFHLLGKPAQQHGGAGFSSFMGVAQSARGTGAARALHQARMQIIGEAGAVGLFADAVHRQALSAEDLAAEARVGSDPTLRRVKLGALGFFTVDIPYWQPVGGPEGGPLKNLDLLYCPLEVVKTVSLRLVTDTMQAYWQSWLGAERAAEEAEALAQRTGQDPIGQSPIGQGSVALLSAAERPRAFARPPA